MIKLPILENGKKFPAWVRITGDFTICACDETKGASILRIPHATLTVLMEPEKLVSGIVAYLGGDWS